MAGQPVARAGDICFTVQSYMRGYHIQWEQRITEELLLEIEPSNPEDKFVVFK